jgi:membrane associated rhomboid family serine protease
MRRVPLVSLGYASVLVAAHFWLESLRPAHRARVLMSTSTDVYHLEHDPWRVLPLSALWAQGWLALWVLAVAICLGLLELSFGALPTLGIAAGGHLLGTIVSEGVVALRVNVGDLPASARHLLDVGPSYVVVACGVALAAAPSVRRSWRLVAALSLVPLTIESLDGLPSGEVDAIGHVVAAAVGAAIVLVWHRHDRRRHEPAAAP